MKISIGKFKIEVGRKPETPKPQPAEQPTASPRKDQPTDERPRSNSAPSYQSNSSDVSCRTALGKEDPSYSSDPSYPPETPQLNDEPESPKSKPADHPAEE